MAEDELTDNSQLPESEPETPPGTTEEKGELFDADGNRISQPGDNNNGDDADRTVILSMLQGSTETQLDDFTLSVLAINPVIEHASKLIAAMMQLRSNPENVDLDILHESLVAEIKAFETRLINNNYDRVSVLAMRYCMCTVLDEFVLRSRVGGASDWSSRSLLNTFYNETWGGEKFFKVLEKLNYEPKQNLHLLELLYICIRLGFHGRYRVADSGREELIELSDDLFNTIRQERGDFERVLAPTAKRHIKGNQRIRYRIPIWGLVLLIVGGLAGSYWYLLDDLDNDTAATHNDIQQTLQQINDTSASR